MEIIPAIDLLEGNCVRLHKGDYKKVTKFNTDPVSQAKYWESKGAKRLHLVDLDGARTGLPVNDSNIKAITKNIDIPVQIGGGIRTRERAEELLGYGIENVILGTVAVEEPELRKEIAKRNPGKVIVGIDSKDGKVATRGWVKENDLLATDFARRCSEEGISSIIATDISTDGTLQGPNLEHLKSMALSSEVPIIASGGVGAISDLIALNSLKSFGIDGVIVGRALYEGTLDLMEAIKTIKNLGLQDLNTEDIFVV